MRNQGAEPPDRAEAERRAWLSRMWREGHKLWPKLSKPRKGDELGSRARVVYMRPGETNGPVREFYCRTRRKASAVARKLRADRCTPAGRGGAWVEDVTPSDDAPPRRRLRLRKAAAN